MKNILFYFEYIILTLIIGSCILIATIIDIVVKVFAAIVYLFILLELFSNYSLRRDITVNLSRNYIFLVENGVQWIIIHL